MGHPVHEHLRDAAVAEGEPRDTSGGHAAVRVRVRVRVRHANPNPGDPT